MTIFVSYSREDHKKIQSVLTELRDNGFDLWIDEEGIEGAAFWRKEIVEAIKASSVVLFFATEASCKSDAVFKELALANEENKPILPILLANIKLPSDLRYQVAGIQNINLSVDRERGIRNIVASLSRLTNTDVRKASEIGNDQIKPSIRYHCILKIRNIGLIVSAFSLLLVASIYLYIPNISNVSSHDSPEEVALVNQAGDSIRQETRSIEEAPIVKSAPKVTTQVNIGPAYGIHTSAYK